MAGARGVRRRALSGVIISWPKSSSADDDEGLLAAASFMLDAAGGERGCMWSVAHRAAERGSLPLLQLILEHPLGYAHSWRTRLLQAAARGGCEEVIKFTLMEEPPASPRILPMPPCPFRPNSWSCCLPALVSGNLAAATCLYGTLGVTWAPDALAQAVRGGCFLSALQWMVERGAPAGPGEVRQALEGAKRAEVREWLVSLLPCGDVRREAIRFVLACTTAGRLSRRNSF